MYQISVLHPMACTQALEDTVMAYLQEANIFGFGDKVKNKQGTVSEKAKVSPDGVDEIIIELDGSL